MFIRSLFVTAASCTLLSLAAAGDIKPYAQNTFDALTSTGKPVVLHFWASWCPTCKAQKPVLSQLMQASAYKDVTMLTVDYDAEKPLLQKYQVKQQSTLVAFKGGKEVGRSTGEVDREPIESLVRKAVQ